MGGGPKGHMTVQHGVSGRRPVQRVFFGLLIYG